MTPRLSHWALPVLAVLALPLVSEFRVDNTVERWVNPTGAQRQFYDSFGARFGSDEVIVVAVTATDVWAPAVLDSLLDLCGTLEAIPGVARVSGVPIVYRDHFGGEDPDALRAEVSRTPFYQDLFVGSDQNTLGLLIYARPGAPRGPTVDAVRRALAAVQDIEAHVAGPPVLNVALDRASARETATYFPVAVVVSFGMLVVLLGSWRAAALAAGAGAVAVLLTVELMAVANRPLNLVTSAVPPLVWVLALATAVRLFEAYRDASGVTPAARVDAALRAVWRPCVLASLTTAAGFLSLVVAPMRPVRELGVFSAAGAMLGLAVVLWSAPPLLRHVRLSHRRSLAPSRMLTWGLERPWLSIVLFGAFCLAAGISLPAVSVQSNPLTFLSEDSTVAQDYAFVRDRLTGWYTLELMIETPNGWLDSDTWAPVNVLESTLATIPGVVRTMSPYAIVRLAHHWQNENAPYELPGTTTEAQGLVHTLGPRERAELDAFVAPDGNAIRVAVFVNTMDSDAFNAIATRARDALATLPKPLHGAATGIVLQLVDAQRALVRTQLVSLGGALVTVFLCVAAGLRSIRLTMLAILPNVVPVAAVALTMALAGIALDPATAMVASIAVGVAVDDTVHVLANLRDAQQPTLIASMRAVLQALGPAMISTTLTTSAGFAVLALSDFRPIRWFGLLSCIALLIALAADLWLLPAQCLVIAREPRHGSS